MNRKLDSATLRILPKSISINITQMPHQRALVWKCNKHFHNMIHLPVLRARRALRVREKRKKYCRRLQNAMRNRRPIAERLKHIRHKSEREASRCRVRVSQTSDQNIQKRMKVIFGEVLDYKPRRPSGVNVIFKNRKHYLPSGMIFERTVFRKHRGDDSERRFFKKRFITVIIIIITCGG